MDIEALRSFLAFVDTGSFTRAAKQTFKTQSAVSMQMKRLESELGKPLFEKQGRNLNLTKDGQSLALYARQLLQLHDDTLNQIKGQDVETVIRLGCPDDYAESVLPNFVCLLRKEIPNLDLQIVCTPSNRVRMMLDSGRLDIGIVSRPAGSEEGYLLSNDRGVWLIGEDKNLLEQRPIPLVLLQKECQYYASATEGLTKKQIPFKVVASCASAVALTGLIRSGQAIGALAIQNTGEGISILKEDWLPPLPAVDIVLVTSSIARNKFPADLARRLSDKYQTEYS